MVLLSLLPFVGQGGTFLSSDLDNPPTLTLFRELRRNKPDRTGFLYNEHGIVSLITFSDLILDSDLQTITNYEYAVYRESILEAFGNTLASTLDERFNYCQ